MRVAIIDVGCGNVGSIDIAFARLGAETFVTGDVEAIASAERVVLPGVGAAGLAMERIRAQGLLDPIRALKQPVVGICLGMQLLFEHSEEEGVDCLGIIPGHVRKLEPAPERPVPHMGWSKLEVGDDTVGLSSGDYVYFAHSFAADHGAHSIATADYGRPIPAAVRKNNFLGAQFHPERSGDVGARFLKAFLEI